MKEDEELVLVKAILAALYKKFKEYCAEYGCTEQELENITNEFNKNEEKLTFAMFLARKGIKPPEAFQHDPEKRDVDGWTVAMYLAANEVEVPERWRHKKTLKTKNGLTI